VKLEPSRRDGKVEEGLESSLHGRLAECKRELRDEKAVERQRGRSLQGEMGNRGWRVAHIGA
jgi:hypothetical protein